MANVSIENVEYGRKSAQILLRFEFHEPIAQLSAIIEVIGRCDSRGESVMIRVMERVSATCKWF